MKKLKKILLISLIIIVVIVTGLVILIKILSAKPAVSNNYSSKVVATGILEQKYTGNGSSEVGYIEYESDDENIRKIEIWYPKEIENGIDKYPVVIMANGTGVPASKYQAIFNHLASWGFIVVGNEDYESWDGESTSKSLDYILGLNSDSDSIFYDKINAGAIGVAGHSQGGVAAINAVTNYENSNRYKSIYTASTTQLDLCLNLKWSYDVSKIRIPYFMVAGDGKFDAETISPYKSLKENYDAISSEIPKVMARRKNTDHGQMLANADGYMTAWFCYTLMNDQEAKKVFCEDSAELISNISNWMDVLMENLEIAEY